MKDWTGIEIEQARQDLEQASALALGRMLFEFSRLDFALGLCLVWSGEGQELDHLSSDVENFTFHKRLDLLKKLVDTKFSTKQGVQAQYVQWLKDADTTRQIRNELVHGRWGIEPTKGQMINVIGLPTSPNQRTKDYTIEQLKGRLEEIVALTQRLNKLREKWPV
jgi:hypothetical protein